MNPGGRRGSEVRWGSQSAPPWELEEREQVAPRSTFRVKGTENWHASLRKGN